jgi:hypothetical protein
VVPAGVVPQEWFRRSGSRDLQEVPRGAGVVPEICRKSFPTVEWRWPEALAWGQATRENDWWEAWAWASQGQR